MYARGGPAANGNDHTGACLFTARQNRKGICNVKLFVRGRQHDDYRKQCNVIMNKANKNTGKHIRLSLFVFLVVFLCGCSSRNYNKAQKLTEDGDYKGAKVIYEKISGYKDSSDLALFCEYKQAVDMFCEHFRWYGAFVADGYEPRIEDKIDVFTELENIFSSFGNYRLSSQITALLKSMIDLDYSSFSDALAAYGAEREREDEKAVPPSLLLGSMQKSVLTLEDSFALLTAYNRFNPEREDLVLSEGALSYPSEGMLVDGEIYRRCGKSPGGKLMILIRQTKPDTNDYGLPLRVMSALSDDLRPSSLDEVEYMLFFEYDYENKGKYNNGAAAIQEYADITLYHLPDMSIIKKWGRIDGSLPPDSYNSSGSGGYKSGGWPDREKVHGILFEAVSYLGGELMYKQ